MGQLQGSKRAADHRELVELVLVIAYIVRWSLFEQRGEFKSKPIIASEGEVRKPEDKRT